MTGDTLLVTDPSGVERRVMLASVRAPRIRRKEASEPYVEARRSSAPCVMMCSTVRLLCSYALEAKEFLRKRLIGKQVTVHVDYKKPPVEGTRYTDDRVFVTVRDQKNRSDGVLSLAIYISGSLACALHPSLSLAELAVACRNVAEGLVAAGLCTVIRHREEEERSVDYDRLMAAQAEAQKKGKKVHSKKDPPISKENDITGDANKAKMLLSRLKGRGRVNGIVDYIVNACRYKVRASCVFSCCGRWESVRG